MQERRCRAGLWASALSVIALSGMFVGTSALAEDHIGLTKPSEERKLSFSFPGVVREVLVKKGERVKPGQPVLRLDERIYQAELKKNKVDAESELKIDYAKQSMDQKQVRHQRVQELSKEGAASPLELEEAELNAKLAVTQYKLSFEEQAKFRFDVEGLTVKVELCTLASTIDGIVQDITVREGEYADPQQSTQRAAATVVQIDPLKVEVYLPAGMAESLKLGQELEVGYPNEQAWSKAKIEFLDPVADSASGTRKVELTMPNPQGRTPGWQVNVRVPGQQK